MTIYQIVSLINSFGLAFAILRMTNIIREYNVTDNWAFFFFEFYVSLFFALTNQLFTLFTPANYGWALKCASLVMWISALSFCKAIKKDSVLK